jgi:hypothetical protein
MGRRNIGEDLSSNTLFNLCRLLLLPLLPPCAEYVVVWLRSFSMHMDGRLVLHRIELKAVTVNASVLVQSMIEFHSIYLF